MADFEVRGANQLEEVARRLKAAGAGDLRKELLAGIRAANKPVIAEIRASARENLPKSGGLAALIASSSYGTRTRTSGNSVGVQIRGTSRSVKGLRALNAGRLRHPVFGNRSTWVEQSVTPGFFSKPIEKSKEELRHGIETVLADIAKRIER